MQSREGQPKPLERMGLHLHQIFTRSENASPITPVKVSNGQLVVALSPIVPDMWERRDGTSTFFGYAVFRREPGATDQRTLLVASRVIVNLAGKPKHNGSAEVGRASIPVVPEGRDNDVIRDSSGSLQVISHTLSALYRETQDSDAIRSPLPKGLLERMTEAGTTFEAEEIITALEKVGIAR